VSVRLDPGDQLVLYTDGVTDAVGPDDRFGEARLASTLSREGGAAELVEHMRETLEAFSSGRRRDDTALLALERLGARPATPAVGTGGEGRHHLELPASEEAPAIARRFVDGRLDGALADRRLADVRLLVSELVTNAVLHATRREGDVLDLDVVITSGHVRVEVHDPGPGFSPASKPAPPPVEATTGRGLMLVDRIANRWGVDRGRRTCVWFEIDRS
jgi:anti-sigma regulatory factor (Ser/Thr protein kinase)